MLFEKCLKDPISLGAKSTSHLYDLEPWLAIPTSQVPSPGWMLFVRLAGNCQGFEIWSTEITSFDRPSVEDAVRECEVNEVERKILPGGHRLSLL